VGYIRLVTSLALKRLIAGQTRRGHAHLRNRGAAITTRGNNNAVGTIPNRGDARSLVPETVGKTDKDIAPFNDM